MGKQSYWPQVAGLVLLLLASGSIAAWRTQPRMRTILVPAASGTAPAVKTPQVPLMLELQQNLAALGYLPVGWNGTAFTYPTVAMPQPLRALFQPGKETLLVRGAIMTYETARGLSPTHTSLGALLQSLENDAKYGRKAKQVYTYIYVSEGVPERLLVWSPRGVLQNVPTNTGVPGAKTALGSYPVYLRLVYQVMKGHDLNGAAYADPVYYISYFHGGEAVHGFYRQSYGFPQSLGCVEIPPVDARAVYNEIQIGTLVTVGSGPARMVAPPPPPPPPVTQDTGTQGAGTSSSPGTTTGAPTTQTPTTPGTPASGGSSGASQTTTAPSGTGTSQGSDTQDSSGTSQTTGGSGTPAAPPAGP